MSEEEKNIEELTETIIEPETEDDVREAFEINKEDGPRESLGAPLIKAAGDPEPADMTMIHKHLDNFLAMIAGETPVDSNVRNSTEYWLNRIADVISGKQVQLYEHNAGVYMVGKSNVRFNIITRSNEPFTIDSLSDYIKNLPGDHLINVYGVITEDGVTFIPDVYAILWSTSENAFKIYYVDAQGYHAVNRSALTYYFNTITDQVRAL